MKLENRFRTRLSDRLKAHFGSAVYIQKNHGNEYSSGLPDMLVEMLGAGAVHLELKAIDRKGFDWSEQPTKLQVHTLRALHAAGARVGVVLYVAEHDVSLSVHGATLFHLIDRSTFWTRSELALAGVHTMRPHPLLGAHALAWHREVDGPSLATHLFGDSVTRMLV